jgi:hypothetical protein
MRSEGYEKEICEIGNIQLLFQILRHLFAQLLLLLSPLNHNVFEVLQVVSVLLHLYVDGNSDDFLDHLIVHLLIE